MDFKQLQAYAGLAPALPEVRRQAWELIGRGKMVMDEKLRLHDLALQGIVFGWEKMDLPTITDAIKRYKVQFSMLQSDRKDFTVWLDEAKTQCLPVENSWKPDVNPTFASMSAREITLRRNAADEVKSVNDKLDETASFKTHMITELQNLACDYRDKLRNIVHDAYVLCLKQKTPVDQVVTAINAALAAMRVTSPREIVRYERKHLTEIEAGNIYNSLVKPDYEGIFNDVVKQLNDKFSLYANDLANADQLVEVVQQDFAAEQKEQHQQDNAKTQAAALYVQATTQVMKVVPGVKPVTELLQIKRDPSSRAFVAIIMTAFLSNFEVCMDRVRVKKENPDFTTLSIDRMCTALDACNIRVEGVEYISFQK